MVAVGTRDAAQNWEIEYTQFLTEIGFKASPSIGCMFTAAQICYCKYTYVVTVMLLVYIAQPNQNPNPNYNDKRTG